MSSDSLRAVLCREDARVVSFALAQHLTLLQPVKPTAIVVTDEDVYWASDRGIHSLLITTGYGGHPTTCINLPLGRFFRVAAITDAEWDQGRSEVRWTAGDQVFVYDYRKSGKRPGAEHAWRVEHEQAA